MRVVSLLPAATEMVAALGATDTLVGVSHECDHPPVMASRARVTSSRVDSRASAAEIDASVREVQAAGTGLYTLDEPLIRSLHPDLIITQALCDVCAIVETDVRALAARLDPSPTIVTLSAGTLDGMLEDLQRVAVAIDRQDEARELIAGLHARIRRVHETLKAAKAPRPRMAFLEWTEPVFPGGHWVPEMIRRAGGVDVLAAPGAHAHAIPLETVAAADPELVVIAPCGYDLDRSCAEARTLLDRPAWAFLRERPVWCIDANALSSRPGPRLVDGIETLARIMNPHCFSPIDPSHARRVNG